MSGRREFDEGALFALEFVRLSQSAGFTLAETKSLLDAFADNSTSKGVWRLQAQEKRDAIRKQIKELMQMDQILSEFLSCGCSTLSECVKNGVAKHAGS